ncbi:phage holin family protein [Butyrivibrio sp. MB2005]|uniref:phage holin family protein n=1 Tax=Butyrivibrio sp. MB2005 TaxID=1280678 RepID=UPI000426EE20|nr:phage holin family protein [Butyrivibrio sp. MB2005]
MKNVVTIGQYIFSGIGGVMGWIFGGFDGFLYALIVFVVIDYLTGVMAAIYTKQLSSEVGFKGIARKVAIFLLVGVGNIIDVEILKAGAVLRTAVIFFYISNEGISIIENAARLDLPIPKKLIDVLEQIKDSDVNDKTSK